MRLRVIDYIRTEKNAKIFAHYYQIPPIQEIADVVADSLKLAQEAEKLEGIDLLVSCTVDFMAEQTKIANPDLNVVLPDTHAGCSIADGMSGKTVRNIRKNFPGAKIISYINVGAEVKAEVDSLCTSANASDIASKIEGDRVLMLPDYFFSTNIMTKLQGNGKRFIAYKGMKDGMLSLEDVHSKREYRIKADDPSILPQGVCFVHELFRPGDVRDLKKKHNVDLVMAHPEVNPDVVKFVDYVGGTAGMIEYVRETDNSEYIVLTECNLTWQLIRGFPEKKFHTPCTICPHMKRNSVNGLLVSIYEEINKVKVDPVMASRARKSLSKMFELTA